VKLSKVRLHRKWVAEEHAYTAIRRLPMYYSGLQIKSYIARILVASLFSIVSPELAYLGSGPNKGIPIAIEL
jgi:hypothetical protein